VSIESGNFIQFKIRKEKTTTSPINMLLKWLLMAKIFIFAD